MITAHKKRGDGGSKQKTQIQGLLLLNPSVSSQLFTTQLCHSKAMTKGTEIKHLKCARKKTKRHGNTQFPPVSPFSPAFPARWTLSRSLRIGIAADPDGCPISSALTGRLAAHHCLTVVSLRHAPGDGFSRE